MDTLTVVPRRKGSLAILDLEKPEPRHNEVLLKTKRVGICGTDRDIVQGLYGEAPTSSNHLVIGHEALTTIEKIGDSVEGFSKGELVVPTVRRPCPEFCVSCTNHESDMCFTGNYSEHGIYRLDGFASEYCVSDSNFLAKVPEKHENVAVLLEPMSIVEKGVHQLKNIQHQRLHWQPRKALVIGAGAIGLLATARLLLDNVEVWTAATRDKSSVKATIAEDLGAHYVNVKETRLQDLAPFDIIIEGSGNLRAAAESLGLLQKNGVLCLLGIYAVDQSMEGFAKRFTDMVLGNRLILGSVNANKKYFELGLQHFSEISERKGDILRRLITRRLNHENSHEAFVQNGETIKTVIEFS